LSGVSEEFGTTRVHFLVVDITIERKVLVFTFGSVGGNVAPTAIFHIHAGNAVGCVTGDLFIAFRASETRSAEAGSVASTDLGVQTSRVAISARAVFWVQVPFWVAIANTTFADSVTGTVLWAFGRTVAGLGS